MKRTKCKPSFLKDIVTLIPSGDEERPGGDVVGIFISRSEGVRDVFSYVVCLKEIETSIASLQRMDSVSSQIKAAIV